MAIFSPLSIGRSALLAHQRAITTTGQNIANAQTPGYRRQTTEFASQDGSLGYGVRAVAVESAVDRFLEAQLLQQGSRSAAAGLRRDLLDRVQDLFPVEGPTVQGSLDAFWADAQRLADRPEDLAVRSDLLSRAAELSGRVRAVFAGVAALQRESDQRLGGEAKDANVLLHKIASLNEDIVAAESGGERANELRDQRDGALAKLAEHVEIGTTEHESGAVDVALKASGLSLVLGSDVQELTVEAGPVTGLDGTALSSVGVKLPSGAVIELPGNPGGRMGALLALRDTDLPARAGELDVFALALRDAVNAVQTDPAARDLDGLVGTDLFSGTGAGDLTVALSDARGIAAAVGTSLGDNGNALALVGVREASQASLGGSTLVEFHARIQSSVGSAARTAADQATVESGAKSSLEGRRDAVSAVSLEEEFTDLIRFQRGFQAAAQLISVSDGLLEELIGLVR